MTSIDTPPLHDGELNAHELDAAVETAEIVDTATRARRLRPIDVIGPILVFAAFIGFWYWMSYDGMSENRRFLVPPPHEVIDESFLNSVIRSELLSGLWVTTKVALWGLAIAIVLGVAIAVVMSQAKWVERALYPYAVALQAIPILALVPLIGILFDYKMSARVLVCVIIALFPIVNNTLFGLLSAEQGQHDLFTLHHARRWTRLRKLQLPVAMPAMFSGFRISAGLSVIGAIVGEFFFRRGEKGLGILIDQYRARTLLPQMYGAVVLAVALGIVVFWIFGLLTRLAVGRWYQESRAG